MDLAKFINAIYNLPNLNQEDYPLLVELSEKYPWFGTAHILQAKCLNNENKYGFKQSLKKASVYSGNREVLYDLMHDIGFFAKPSPPLIISEDTNKELVTEEPTRTFEVLTSDETEVGTEEIINPLEESPVEEPTVTDTTDKVITTESAEPIGEEIVKTQTPEIEKSLDEVSTVADLDISTKTNQIPVDKEAIAADSIVPSDELELNNRKHINVYDPEKELQKLIGDQADQKDETPEEITEEIKVKHDFLAWLEVVKPANDDIVTRQPRKLPMSDESKQLLENFIKNRPSVNRLKQINTLENTNKNTAHTTEYELVSETLAKLYLKQNLPEKALSVYKKLQLQNPQKFSYFAALIEEVEKLVSQTQ